MRSYSAAAGLLAAAVLAPSGTDGALGPDVGPTGEMAAADFLPLACNGAMNDGVFSSCVPWSDQNYDPAAEAAPVTVPCGTCVDMDLPEGTELHFKGGLDIQGALRFPANWKGTITSKFIFVQGHLVIDNDRPVEQDNIDGLKFILEGTDDQQLFPNGQNAASCVGGSCDVGKKPFVVAGGQVHVNALPDTCPTWVSLLDVVTDDTAATAVDYPVAPAPETGCTNDIINLNFETSYEPFMVALGSDGALNPGGSFDGSTSFKVENRQKSWQGPFVDLSTSGAKNCIVEGQTYLVSAKVKVSVEDSSGNSTYSNCHRQGTDCLGLVVHAATAGPDTDGKPIMQWNTFGEIEPSRKYTDDTWFDFTAEVVFDTFHFADDSLYVMMYLGGPEAGISIEIDDFKMVLPGSELFPDAATVCDDLVINGDAELAAPHKFPWGYIGNLGSSVSVKSETVDGATNNYFAIRGRDGSYASINTELINDCIVRQSQYTISAKVRIHSADEQDVRLVLKTSPDKTESVGFGGIPFCVGLSAQKGWVECTRHFLFTEEHEAADKIELAFMVPGDETSDIDFDDISVVRSAAPLDQFVVDNAVASCWGPGATILQTSHTLSASDENVLTIESIVDNGDGTATIKTTTPVAKPSTQVDNSNYAVEIALLDRNVKIMPASDDAVNPLHGGHFTIAHTPNVAQTLKGIHLSGMGQQGNFGRYPVHLHMNKNIEGSDISRNLVRGSNQRCYVVHGTHGVNLEYNIAHDTFGHCFMLEDGIEQNNTFNFNLGSGTKETPEEGILSIAESDMFCATFWMSNPLNYFQGNVAAGSADTGFWYEFLETVRGPSVALDPDYDVNPSSFQFGHFKENRFHSNGGEGFKLYPNGYFPETRAVFENSVSIKNKGSGVLLHNSRNLGIDGGFYGDNRMQIEVDKGADDVTVKNAAVVGFSDLYQFESEAGGYDSHCPAHRPISGVQLHSFLRFRDSKGYALENVDFSNFEADGSCVGTSAISIDGQTRDGHFDAFATLQGLSFAAGAPMKEKFNMCDLAGQDQFIGDLAINDIDGSLHPSNTTTTPGFIVSDSALMTAFMTDGACQAMDGSCSLFCENACFRTINFAVPMSSDYDDMVMEVVDGTTGNSVEFPGYFETKTTIVDDIEVEDVYENYGYQRRRYYSPIVPYSGNYTLKFKKSGADYWPIMAEMVWEDEPLCSPFVDDANINFVIPEASEAQCGNLIRNSGGEQGGAGTFDHWMHAGGGIKVHPEGHTGSFSISSDGRTGAWQGPGQFLDVRCLSTVGEQYEIIAKFKLIDSASGAEVDCDPNQKDVNADNVCPRVSFRMRQLQGNRIGDGVEVNYAYPMAEAVAPFTSGDWNDIYGVFSVTETMAAADAIFMFIERARAGVDIVVDQVIIQPTVQGCANAIYNGDFEAGDMRFWKTIGHSDIAMLAPGHNSNYALETTRRDTFWSSMAHDINLDCLVEGEDYSINGYIRLKDKDGNFVDCDPTLTWGENSVMTGVCPSLHMRIVAGNITEDRAIGQVTSPWTLDTGNQWNEFNSIFKADAEIVNADSVTIFFTRYEAGGNIVIDDVSMTPVVPKDPAQLVNNGDGETGNTNYISAKGSVVLDVSTPGYESNYSFVVSNRAKASDGLSQMVDNSVLEAGIMYKLHAKVKLIVAGGTTPFDCDPNANIGDKKCPGVSLRTTNPAEPPTTRPVATVQGEWKSGDWNTIEGFITFTAPELSAQGLQYFIAGAKAGVDMVLDNIELRKTDINPSALMGETATS